ncbi:ribonuclease H family protein [Actinomyces minihominis]|uniref:ribonuclease H family protein n=1 Tax=Actinomyces minihominis TaxID=2002838 RepID=UPI000C089128
MTITAAVDGSALGNPGPAGWAWVVSPDAWAAGGFPKATNNIGELMALVRLLEDTAEAGFADEPLVVLADSQYVINSVTKWMPGWKKRGWKKADGKPVLNRELMERIDRAMTGRNVRFEWVKGHAGHDMNEAADLRARAAAEAYKTGRTVPTGPGFTETMASRTALAAARPRTERRNAPPTQSNRGTERTRVRDTSHDGEPIVAISAAQAPQRWAQVLQSARQEPVTITEPGQPSLLLLDADTAWQALALLDGGGAGDTGYLF